MFDLEEVLKKLKKQRQIFTSEADFQLELGRMIKDTYKKCEVRMEYTPEYDYNIHIDILVIIDNKWIPIELKYKTCGTKDKDGNLKPFFDKYDKVEGLKYYLKEQYAQNNGCSNYENDIKRIEDFKKNERERFLKGYTVFLTNDSGYFKPKNKNNLYNIEKKYKKYKASVDIYSKLEESEEYEYFKSKKRKKDRTIFKYMIIEII